MLKFPTSLKNPLEQLTLLVWCKLYFILFPLQPDIQDLFHTAGKFHGFDKHKTVKRFLATAAAAAVYEQGGKKGFPHTLTAQGCCRYKIHTMPFTCFIVPTGSWSYPNSGKSSPLQAHLLTQSNPSNTEKIYCLSQAHRMVSGSNFTHVMAFSTVHSYT